MAYAPSDDTIVAPGTPAGRSAIAVVRMSGPDAVEIAGKIAHLLGKGDLASMPSHALRRGGIESGGVRIDDVLIAVMREPRSYTGEDMIEFHLPGNPVIVETVARACMREGARAALPGEFTKRAFLNGKMDLVRAEAVARMIEAESDAAVRAAARQAGGELSRGIDRLRSRILDILAEVEAGLEFPEEELGQSDGAAVEQWIAGAAEECRALLERYRTGERIRAGARVVLVGKPNAGKSSIFNRILSRNRSIVTPDRGTTRDVVEETIFLQGRALRLSDTAGICTDHKDEAGRAGVERSVEEAKCSDLLLFIADSSKAWSDEDSRIARHCRGRRGIVVLNKSDLNARIDLMECPVEICKWQRIDTSAMTGQGIDSIISYIIELLCDNEDPVSMESAILLSLEQAESIRKASKSICAAAELARGGGREELISVELRSAAEALGEMAGVNISDGILERIFSRFCVGK